MIAKTLFVAIGSIGNFNSFTVGVDKLKIIAKWVYIRVVFTGCKKKGFLALFQRFDV